MGRKGGWLHAVRKALSSQQKEKKDQRYKSKRILSSEDINLDSAVPSHEEVIVGKYVSPPPPWSPPKVTEEAKRPEFENDDEDEQHKHAYSVALATAKAAEAAVAAAEAAAEVVRLTSRPRSVGNTKEEIAALKIQTAFRGYLARKSLRALRGLMRLKTFVEGQSAKRQAANTLRCMQTLARVQSQIHARRIRMSEENQALMRQLQLKQEREGENVRNGETWDDSIRSKEQIEANLMNKQEAAMRRERALAYAFTHQRKGPKGSNTATFMDPNNPQWGWSWLERWMAARPWETRSDSGKDLNDQSSLKGFRALSLAGEINRTNALRDHSNSVDGTNKPSPSARRLSRAPTRQVSVVGRPVSSTAGSRKATKPGSPEERGSMKGRLERHRRHSIGGGLLERDDDSVASSTGLTKSVKGMKKPPSPGGSVEHQRNGVQVQKQQSVGSAKKRLSFSGSSPSGPRRHSLGGKMENAPSVVRDSPVETD